MHRWPLGCDTYVFSQYMNVIDNLDIIMAGTKSAGFSGIELFASAFEGDEPEKRLDILLKKHKLELISVFYSARMWEIENQDEILSRTHWLVDKVAALRGHYLVVTYPSKGTSKSEADYAVQAETLCEIGQICRTQGLNATVHLYSGHVLENEVEVRRICEDVSEDLLGLGPDLDRISRGGVDPEGFLRRYGSRVNYLHLRDNKNGRWTEALGEGDVDYASLARTLDGIGYEGWIVVELAHERDFKRTRSLRESLTLSREYLRRTMGI